MSTDWQRWRKRLDRVADPLLALIVFGLMAEPLITASQRSSSCGCEPPPWWSWPLVAAACAPLAVRRRWPFAAAFAVGVPAAAYGATELPDPPVNYVALVALYSVAAHATPRRAYAAAAIAAVIVSLSFWVAGDANAQDYAVTGLLCVTAWLLGAEARHRRERAAELEQRADQLERTREAEARRAVIEERNRIARELHDVVAHHVTMMVVLADAGPVVVHSDPDRAAQVFEDVSSAGKEALRDMRRLLGVLRDDGGGRSPQPGLGNLTALVADVRRAGLTADLVVTGTPRDLPPSVELSAYRVAQESLTNALRHAGAGRVDVTLSYGPDHLDLRVVDDGRGCPSPVDGTGTGLAAMRERVAMLDGWLQVGPGPERGWSVHARIPLGVGPA